MPRPPRSTLFPYTTLFRSEVLRRRRPAVAGVEGSRASSTLCAFRRGPPRRDRKSTRLNSSHLGISYAVFCLKKKNPHTRVHPTCAATTGSHAVLDSRLPGK